MIEKFERKKRIGKISVLVVIGMFVAIMYSPIAIAPDVDYTDAQATGSVLVEIDSDFDSSTQIFSVSHDSGTELLRLEETGRLGIGDTSPDFKLEVDGSSGSGYFGVTSSSDGDVFIIDSSGNVGIAVASPSAKAHIVQTAAADCFRVDDDINENSPFVIDQYGNVGIGTGSPSHKLHIYDTDNTANRAGLFIDQNGGVSGRGYGIYVNKGGLSTVNVAGYFSATGGTYNYAIIVDDGQGKVGIGINIPDALTHIQQTGTSDAFRVDDQSEDSSPFVVKNDGDVGIGVWTPNEKLEVDGKIRANTCFNVAGTDGITQTITIVDGSGTHTLYFTGGILYNYTLT